MFKNEKLIKIADCLFNGNRSAMARALEMSPQSLNTYISGKNNPGNEVLSKLAGLGVNVNWFLTGEGEMMVKVQNPSEENERLKAENELLKKAIGAIRLTTESVINEGVKKKK